MGITVTTNLGLIKPDDDESIKQDLPFFNGWADQNADNCDTIDGLFRNNNTTYTLNWTGTTGNPTLGAAGFTEGKYIRLFPRMVLVNFRIYMGGAGFLPGSGGYRINLPFALDPALAALGGETTPLGKAIFLDNSAALTSTIFTAVYIQTGSLVGFRPTAGIVWTDAFPVVPAQQDRLTGYLLYPTAVP